MSTTPTSDDEIPPELARGLERWRSATVGLARAIYEDPEPSGEERRAAARCRELLARAGYQVRDVDSVPTAFSALLQGSAARPCVGLLAEYDALPGVGHACGHHLIAGSAVGAGLILSELAPQLEGSVCVLGCPAEETLQGKVAMLGAGAFDGVDYALTFHAHEATSVMRSSSGLRELTFSFRGRPSHAGNEPWAGASALDGVLLTHQNLNALRQFVRDGVRIHGIVTEGGEALNVVPERAACRIAVRAADAAELERVTGRVLDCARAAALASGTELTVEHGAAIPPLRPDGALAERVRRFLRALGHGVEDWDVQATTDVASVGERLPSVLFSVATWPPGTAFHSHEAARHGGEPRAFEAMLDAALVMAGVALELVGDDGP